MPLSIVIFGATGDLAKKKLFPALYQLCLLGHLPRRLRIVGYGRSAVDLPAFIKKQCVNIKEDPRLPRLDFTARISFHAGGYDAAESYVRLDAELTRFEAGQPGNRLFFLSVPPTSWLKLPPALSDDSAPSASLDHLKAPAASYALRSAARAAWRLAVASGSRLRPL